MIKEFIDSKRNVWAESMLKSEYSRLIAVEYLLDTPPSPEKIWNGLQSKSSYTRLTTFTRIISFYKWYDKVNATGFAKLLSDWRDDNVHLFRKKYKPTTPQISYEQAKEAIEKISSPEVRGAALFILSTGIRSFELNRIGSDSTVLGKGGKTRRVYTKEKPVVVPYHQLYRELKRVGLKPHDLRKIRATQLLRKGMSLPDLQHAFGWNQLETAKCYLAPLQEEKIEKLFEE